jgi:uncharacterized protein (DUF1800 family)
MSLTDRQKIGHLLRRFGFGASVTELAEYEKLGVRGTIERIFDLDAAEEYADPMQFAFRDKEDAEPGGYRFRNWWTLQMATSKRPLKEKLALFWHDHFAVNEEDVGHGIAMLDYMMRIRQHGFGKFRDLLGSMAKSPALMRQLNVEMVTRATPNENFARELLELYTLGEGNGYTERDIKEVAKALTGWSNLDVYWRLGKTNNERLRHMRQNNTPGLFYIYAPEVHIPGPKKVLGKDVESGDDVLDMLAKHPQTARYVCSKLWEWFAYPNPELKVIERLAKRFLTTDGNIKLVLREMAEMDEFYGARSYRKLIKNPVDYCVGIVRMQNASGRVLKNYDEKKPYDSVMDEDIASGAGALTYWISQTGMTLFYPDTVAGWTWHEGWTSTNMLIQRRSFTGIHTWYPVEVKGKEKEWHPDEPVRYVANQIKARTPGSTQEIVNAFCAVYDCPLSPGQQGVLIKHFEKAGGLKALENERHFCWTCTTALQLLSSAPEFHLC